MKAKRYLFLLVIFVVIFGCSGKYGYVMWVGGKPIIKVTDYYADIPEHHVARAFFSNEINSTGWAILEICTSKHSSDERQVFAAGYVEGFLTRDLIYMHWQNMLKGYCYNKIDVCNLIEKYVDKNEHYIFKMVKEHPKSPYWYQMKLYYIQLEGLAAGYNMATNNSLEQLTKRDILWINMLGDLDELAFALTLPDESPDGLFFGDHCTGLVKLLPGLEELYTSHTTWNSWTLIVLQRILQLDDLDFALTLSDESPDGLFFGDHCTGLVKLLPGLQELYTSHTTWNSYQSMLRILKMYVLNIRVSPERKEFIPGRKMAMSSYPAFVQSTDDFLVISSGLVPSETTIGNSNRTLFKNVNPVGQVLEYARAMIAHRLARSGEEWCKIFKRHNSGTYNNQWFIVDYNKFVPSTASRNGSVAPGLLWVLEQLPGHVQTADLTEELLRNTYFPSYNMAYFPNIFNLSGGNVRVRTFGDWFTYEGHPRAKILKQKQGNIHNLRDMYNVMRHNDFKYDPLSRCETCSPPYSGCNAVAARNDLNPANGTFPFRRLGHSSHGATDTKVTSSRLRRAYLFLAESGPTRNMSRGIPPFQWSQFDLGQYISHEGHPDLWVFSPIIHRWQWV